MPLTPETRHLVDETILRRMKPSAYLINTARGPLIDQAALVEALQSGTIAGAGLDVFEQEPLSPDDPLLQVQNVVLTPHAAAFSDRGIRELRRRTGEAAADVLRGVWPRGLANTDVRPRFPLSARTVASATWRDVLENGAGAMPSVIRQITNPGRMTSSRTPEPRSASARPLQNPSNPAFADP